MSHYTDGRRKEYQARDALQAAGWEVIRSAGSKGPVDLVAFRQALLGNTRITDIVFIQVKRTGGTIPPAERLELQRLALIAGALPVVAYQPKPRKPLAWRELTGPGPRDWQAWTPGGDT